MDLTGEYQHGFKQERSTITTALNIQSIISRALDANSYYVLASLDLSAAFDLVNRELLFNRMKQMGIPNDIISLLKKIMDGPQFEHLQDQMQEAIFKIILIYN